MLNIDDFQNDAFKDLQILVIGDAMIDRYYYGQVERMSPEADVPIVDVNQVDNRLGGAANVALNIAKLGAKAHLITITGEDEERNLFSELLEKEGIHHSLLEAPRRTTIKTRVYNDNEYVMRFDIEDTHDVGEEVQNELLANIKSACESIPFDAIILQDYNKGVLTSKSIQSILFCARKNNILVAVDPKEKNFFEYQEVDLFKPNLKELNIAFNKSVKVEDQTGLKSLCTELRSRLACKNILLTLAQDGAVALSNDEYLKVEAHERRVVDVSGAGDTVIAMASLLLALKFPIRKILFYSNLAGGLVIEERGVKALDLKIWESNLGI